MSRMCHLVRVSENTHANLLSMFKDLYLYLTMRLWSSIGQLLTDVNETRRPEIMYN